MINLLPPEERRQLRAARTNTLLLRYNVALIGVLLFVGASLGVVSFYLKSAQTQAQSIEADNNAKAGSYSQVTAEAQAFRASLTNAKQILDQEVTYSKAILAIAHQLPTGVVMDTLSLDATTFGKPTNFTLRAVSQDAAVAAKKSFASSPYFSDVQFVNLSHATSGQYPVTAVLSLVISKDVAK